MVTVENLTTGYVGLSTDTKPTIAVRNGDTFVEIDTNKLYAWNEESGEWVEQASSGGGGGGGGSTTGEALVVEFSVESKIVGVAETVEVTANKTFDQIKSAFDNDQPIYGYVVSATNGSGTTIDVESDLGSVLYLDYLDETYSECGFSRATGSHDTIYGLTYSYFGGSWLREFTIKGDDRVIVNISTQDGQSYTADRTYAELKAAADADKEVVAKFAVPGNEYNTVVFIPMAYSNDTQVTFVLTSQIPVENNPVGVMYFGWIGTSQVTLNTYYFELTLQPK